MSDLVIEKMVETVKHHHMVQSGDTVLIACSGGPDSVFLLHALHLLSSRLELHLHVAHLDHQMRGEESRVDARFVQELASGLGVDSVVESYNVPRAIELTGRSPEECAREVRYRFLERVADDIGAQRIATGHTAEDQAETFLLRLFRGAGTLGLAGIPPVRGRIIRPLIAIYRDEIEEYLTAKGLPFRLDSSNERIPPLRNAVRREMIPWLVRRLNSRVVELLGRTADILRTEEDFLHQQAQMAFSTVLVEEGSHQIVLSRPKLVSLHRAIRRRVVRLAIARVTDNRFQAPFSDVETVLTLVQESQGSRKVDVCGGVVHCQYDHLIFENKHHPTLPPIESTELPIPGTIHVRPHGYVIQTRLVDYSSIPRDLSKLDPKEVYVDLERLSLPLLVRSRRQGDRVCPFGSSEARKVKDLFIEAKVPARDRELIPILEDQERTLWVMGVVRAEGTRITDQTKTAVHVVVHDES